jgi:hypothetical protein
VLEPEPVPTLLHLRSAEAKGRQSDEAADVKQGMRPGWRFAPAGLQIGGDGSAVGRC